MPLTILSDDDLRTLLHSLTQSDILDLQEVLSDALHQYSTGLAEDNNPCCATLQPARSHIKRPDGQTTLFMPASSASAMGVKIVTLAEPQLDGTIGLNPTPPDTSDLTLLDGSGRLRALLNAAEITAFRTALASTLLFRRRANVHDVLIFGAGKQAYWHARLALLLRGPDVHHLNIINRSFERAANLIRELYKTPWPVEIEHPVAKIVTPNHGEYARHLKSLVRGAAVIFCTTPSLSALFPPEILTHTEGRRKGRYIAAIGSYKPHMIEIHPDVIRQAVAKDDAHHRHFHKHAKQGGAIIVDSVESCMREAGEVIQAGLGGRDVVELGELVMLKREDSGDSKKSGKSEKEGKDPNASLKEWLERGNVIYKSVGLGLMDVVIGSELVRLADEREIGTRLKRF
ncbi:NAD(P)-binding protein [Trichodelitschia bisporula]|uniref:NAD(P)-binding protein n=1 Tax=Trichodelitschia bisporula TaxID=703511 RepID=A0A6G1HY98_9PEZI|nr:NAD(P)-binding protein [Trichodelitschia bisporula]